MPPDMQPAGPARRPRLRRVATGALALLLLGAAWSGEITASEASVKAAFLYNFARLVNWPESCWRSADEPFVVAVLGKDPFGTDLDSAFEGKRVGEHAFVVRRVPGIAELHGCHLLYLQDGSPLPKVLEVLHGTAVLIVGEGEGITRAGGSIAFYQESTPDGLKVRFEINPDAASRAGLGVSSKLLSLARVVHDQPEGD